MTTRSEGRFGDVPHFHVRTLDGSHVRYQDIWQRHNLVLVTVSPQEREAAARYASQLRAQLDDVVQAETSLVVTADAVPGLPAPAIVVADRWGEILHSQVPSGESASVSQLPDVDELVSWVHFAEIQCPECPP